MKAGLRQPLVLRPLLDRIKFREQLEEIATGRGLQFPLQLENESVSLVFDSDAEVGVRLRALSQTEKGRSFEWQTLAPAESGHDGRLFEIRGTLEDEEVGGLGVGPTSKGFLARIGRSQGDDRSVVFGWPQIAVPGSGGEESLWVLIRIRIRDGDSKSRWDLWVGREEGHGFSLDEIEMPILWIKGPIASRPFEPQVLAQRRARLLIPNSLSSVQPLASANSSLWPWFLAGIERSYVHPSAGQNIQFSCIYAGDPEDTASHRRMLYLGSEDALGEHKRFSYEGRVITSVKGEEGWLRWSHTYYPPYFEGLSRPAEGEDKPYDEFGNSFASSYPAIIGALQAKSDAWWYDGCELHRDWVETSGSSGPKIRDNRLLTARIHGASLFGTTAFNKEQSGPTPETYGAMLRHLLAWRKALESPGVDLSRSYLHAQYFRDGGNGVDWDPPNPSPPLSQDLDLGWKEVMRLGAHQGVRCSGYTIPLAILSSSPRFADFPKEAAIHARDHVAWSPFIPGHTTPGYVIDLRHPLGASFYAETLYPEMMRAGFGGFYLDTLSGTPSNLMFTPPPDIVPAHPGNLGDVPGRNAAIRLYRSRAGAATLFANAAEPEGDLFVISEATLEGLVGVVDQVQEGYMWTPGHLLMAEDAVIPLGTPEVPMQARDLSPPLWSAVFHEYQPVFRLQPPMNLVGLGSNPRYYPDANGFPGMSPDEFLDVMAFFAYSAMVAGYKPAFADQMDFLPPVLDLDGETLVIDEQADPTGVGFRLFAALQNLWASLSADLAGPFLLDGRFERPLALDLDAGNIDVTSNPTEAWNKVDLRHNLGLRPAGYEQASFALASFPVPRVLHSVWSDAAGRLGLVLANWTREPAHWIGGFDPELYGFAVGSQIDAVELEAGGGSRSLGTFDGPIQIRADDALVWLGGDIYLGPIDPHAVRVIVFRNTSP